MHTPTRLLPILVAAVFCGCSTIETRLAERRPAFEAMSPTFQRLVLTGQITQGMPLDGVYIAWGRPDAISQGSRESRLFETWHYFIYDTVEIPGWDYIPRGYVGRRGRPYYYIDPIYTPGYVTRRSLARWATFENGRVAAWESYLGRF